MVGKEFIDLFRSIQQGSNLSVDDFADRLNLFTVVLLLLCTILISMKQYVFNSISCYIPVSPSGSEFKNYVTDYCWVHGTIPLRPDEEMPTTTEEWNLYDKYRRISKHIFGHLASITKYFPIASAEALPMFRLSRYYRSALMRTSNSIIHLVVRINQWGGHPHPRLYAEGHRYREMAGMYVNKYATDTHTINKYI